MSKKGQKLDASTKRTYFSRIRLLCRHTDSSELHGQGDFPCGLNEITARCRSMAKTGMILQIEVVEWSTTAIREG